MKAFSKIFLTEAKLMTRNLDTIIFGIIFPVGLAMLLGVMFNNQEINGHSSLEQFFGGIIAIGVCATALMGLPLTISDYRDKKILKHFKVTPVSPMIILLVQFMIQMLTAIVSMILVYIAVMIVFDYQMKGNIFVFLISYFVVILIMYSIGLFIASISKNVKKASLYCTLIYFPMLTFSGTTIPYEVMPKKMQEIVEILPLTQGIKLLKATSLGESITSLFLPITILIVLACGLIFVSTKVFKWE